MWERVAPWLAPVLEAIQQPQKSLLFHAKEKDTALLEEETFGSNPLTLLATYDREELPFNLFLTPQAQIPRPVMTTILQTATKNQ